MKLLLVAALSLSTLAVQAQEPPLIKVPSEKEKEKPDLRKLSPLLEEDELLGDERMIEPTSPVLGKKLTAMIRYDERDPEKILEDIHTNYPKIQRDLQISSMTYFKTLEAPLKKYCTTEHKGEVIVEKDVRVLEQGAIPLTILEPLHGSYKQNMSSMKSEYIDCSDSDTEKDARKAAKAYQDQRYDCNVVHQINAMEDKIRKFLPTGKLKGLLALHHEISAGEAAFPRIQFTINGFTQYVYNEIMKIPYDKLADLLKLQYEAQKEWLAAKERGDKDAGRYYSAFEKKALAAGYMPREILLIMSYSTRNMPSLDVQYGQDTAKALMLETYFWKSKKHKDVAQKKYMKDLYPNHVMKRDPGSYHYATSALMACDIRLSGYSGVMARVVALGNKVAYKVHKLLGAVKGKEGKKGGIKGVLAEAKQQAFKPGIDAGRFGGAYGLKLCRKHTPKDQWLKNKKHEAPPESDAVDEALDGEDLTPDQEQALEE
jgi:hypothetical protein